MYIIFFLIFLFSSDLFSKEDNVYDIISKNPNLSTFKNYLNKTGLDDVLKKKIPYDWTIYAPSNNAFEDNQGRTKHRGLPNGNSFKTVTNFLYDDNSVIHISCYDFSKNDTNSSDRISVSLMSPKFIDYQKKAFGN